LHERDMIHSGQPDISWHGQKAGQPDWSPHSRTLAFMLCGNHAVLLPGRTPDDHIYVAMNMHWEDREFELPTLHDGRQWQLFADTYYEPPLGIGPPGEERPLPTQESILVRSRSVVILVGR